MLMSHGNVMNTMRRLPPGKSLQYGSYGTTNGQTMTNSPHPFPLPAKLSPELGQVREYWNGLKRGENKIPFADDVNLSALVGLQGRLVLIDVFDKPQRFRFNIVGDDIRNWYGGDLAGKFVDEIVGRGPLAYVLAQASVTVEAAAPTCHHDGFARLLLPLWGGGYVSALLGSIVRL